MIDIMIDISAYIFGAILLGYFFGWLITKLLLKERYQNHLDQVNKIENKLLYTKQDNMLPHEFQKRLQGKDEVIEVLTSRLSLTEGKQIQLEKKYEEEIDAFMFERVDITQKYKDLLTKFKLLERGIS